MSDEAWADLDSSSTTVVYTSDNTDVASVDENGIVTSGVKEGVTTIHISVTINGKTVSTSYPVVNQIEIKPSPEEVEAAKAELTESYNKLPKAAYSDKNYAELTAIYQQGISQLR